MLLGGSAVPPACLREIRDRRLPVFLTYGMTETAAACAVCPPETIWKNQPPRGVPLPSVHFGLTGDILTVATPALAQAMWPNEALSHNGHPTQDRAELAADGTIRILGRADRVIVSGGEGRPARRGADAASRWSPAPRHWSPRCGAWPNAWNRPRARSTMCSSRRFPRMPAAN